LLGSSELIALVSFSLAFVAVGQTIIKSFPGDAYSDEPTGTPPDTMGAIGTNQFAQLLNGSFAVFSRDGQRQVLMSDSIFWQNAGIDTNLLSYGLGLTDTRLIFDPACGRWFATELTVGFYNVGNSLMLARSDTADPAGTWQGMVLATNTGDFTGPTGFYDFDTLGVDSNGVYICVNNVTPDLYDGSGSSADIFSIPKPDLIAATPSLARMTRFAGVSTITNGYTYQPATSFAGGSTVERLIGLDITTSNVIDILTISNSAQTNAKLSSPTPVQVAYYGLPQPIIQPSGITIDPANEWFQSGAKQVGSNIFAVRHIAWNGRDAIHWLVLNAVSNSLVSEGIISDPNFDFSYGSIAANQRGDILTVFSRSGSNSPAGNMSLFGALGKLNNNTVTMGAPFLILQGTISNFFMDGDSAPYRWGDYSATQVDPTDDQLFWTVNEVAQQTNEWHTQITLISVATNKPALTISMTGASVSVTWPLSTDPAYGLQMSTNLSVISSWQAVTNIPVTITSHNSVTVVPVGKTLFFRLKK
jgi:hypothetical protein